MCEVCLDVGQRSRSHLVYFHRCIFIIHLITVFGSKILVLKAYVILL